MSVTHCSRGNDRSFGPVVDSHCRAFDFTLFFEDVFLACITSFIFLTLGLIRVSQLIRNPVTTVKPSRVVYTSALYGLLLGSELALLGIRQSIAPLQTQASVAAQVLQAADACLALGLSYLEFSRSVRPPIIISLYLFLAVLFEAVRVRSLWLASHSPTAAALSSLVLGTHAVLLLSESQGKDKYMTTPFSRDTTREERSGLWGLCLLTWVLPVLQRGLLYPLGLEDIPPVDQKLTAERLIRRLLSSWKQVNQSKKNQLLITLFRTYRTEFFSAVIPRLCFSGFTIMQPLLVSTIIRFVALPDSSETMNKGYGLIAASAIVYVGLAVSTVLYSRQTYRFIIAVRGRLIAAIYRQTLKLRTEDLGTASAITLMGTDVERIALQLDCVIYTRYGHRRLISGWLCGCWKGSLQYLVLCLLSSPSVSKSKNRAQRAWIEKVELRIHATRQVLNNIKSFKILGLEDRLKVIISGFRSIEIITSWKFRSLIYWEVLISSFPWLVAPGASFTLFTIISTVSKEGALVPSRAFTAFSLMTLITMPVWTFIQTLPAIVQCLGSFSRIQDYIALSSSRPSFSQHGTESSPALVPVPPSIDSLSQEKAPLVNFRNTFLRWTPSGRNVLSSINLSVRKGAIIGIMGPVGSGKTMLFESILGETIINQGQIFTAPVPVAYCTQTSWLLDASIRRNIVDPLEFNLSEKDSTRVGGQGNTLSGGQKQRVALARAIYSGCELLLLDDIFSGLDPVTISKICRRLLDTHQGYLRRRGITVILSTHNTQVAACADEIFLLKDGTAVPYEMPTYPEPDSVTQNPLIEIDDIESDWSQSWQQLSDQIDDEPFSDDSNCDSKPRLTHRDRDRSAYSFYIQCAGRVLTSLYVILVLIFAFCQNFSTLWMKWWSNANSESPNLQTGMYLGVFIALGAGAVIIGAASSWVYLIHMISNTAERLHLYLLKALLGAPLSWLNETNSGDILNRFIQDLELTDMTLPLAAINTTKAFGACLMKMIILLVVAKYMSLTIPPLLIICYLLQKYYLRTSRQVRLLSIEAKAPLYQHLSETLSGVSTIRAFRWQQWFDKKNLSLVDDSQKCAYTLYMIQQWLTLTMDMLASGLVVLLMILIVFRKKSFDLGSSGTAVVTLMSFTQSLVRLLNGP